MGNPLLSSSTPSCNTTNLSFFPSSATVLAQGSVPNCTVDLTNCGTAVQYSSAAVTATVYTPFCWEPGSSLCHFEDMCTHPSGTTVCTGTAGNWNNFYFDMVNATGMGSCYIKRYLKDEERFVLCDLGYSVNGVNSSTVSSANYSYSAGSCSGTDIWGVNDGFNGGVYTFSTTGNSIAIPISSITLNDSPFTSTISCLEVVYNNATVSTSGSSLIVNSSQNMGLVLIKYIPQNTSGKFGNATYIYVYFFPGACNAGNDCNLVQNGGFEYLAAGTASCGSHIGSNYNNIGTAPISLLNCWQNYELSPDLFTRGCSTGGAYDLGINTYGTTLDSFSGPSTGNDRIVGIASYSSTPNNFNEVLKNNLSSALTPSNVYQVSFMVCNYTGSISVANANPNAAPVVISLASEDNFLSQGSGTGNYPLGLNILTEFTVNAATNSLLPWTLVTHTFVFNQSLPHNVLLIGVDVAKTAAQVGAGGYYYVFLDEVKLYQYPTSATFSIPTASVCGNATYTNLNTYASTTGTFSGQGVTFNSPNYDFNLSGTLTVGTYPVAFTYSTTCLTTLWENIVVSPIYTLSPILSNTLNCSNITGGVAMFGIISPANNNLNYVWQPGNLTGPIPTASPLSTTIYTVTATDVNNCSGTTTLAVNVPTNCCSSPSIQNFSATSIPGNTVFTGPMIISSDFTIQAGTTAFLGGEFVFTNNAKITVASGAILDIRGSHFYACGANMWQGIVVQNGGVVYTSNYNGNDCLIEDAITAIDVSNSSSHSTILDIENTIFNKNHIGINISNYTESVNPYPFKIENCVFTCRDMPFSNTTWPSTGASSSVTGISAQVRTAISSTTDIFPPYLSQTGFSITTLKNPYLNLHSRVAIELNNVGVTSGSVMYGINIGSSSNASDFNLFDAHNFLIQSVNSNLFAVNNVFQNTMREYFPSVGAIITTYSLEGGAAIEHITNNQMNTKLDLTAPNSSLGNRFWDCVYGVDGNQTYKFDISNAIFRSTQSSTFIPPPAFYSNWPGVHNTVVGQSAITLNSNRFEQNIQDNEFSNITIGIQIGSVPGSYYVIAQSYTNNTYGIYAGNISIKNNTFSPVTNISNPSPGNNYLNYAISLDIPFSTTMQVASGSSLVVQDNILDRVFRGIYINGMSGLPTLVKNNVVTLRTDYMYSTSQSAIEMDNTIGSATNITNNVIETNTLSCVPNSTANLQSSLIFCGMNIGPLSPRVICNDLKWANQGFVFHSSNAGAYWRGNTMEDIGKGMVLNNNGIIGVQGGSLSPIDNEWNGSWTNYKQTSVDNSSNANNSKLWVQSGSPWEPTINDGLFTQNYTFSNNISIVASGSYTCGGGPNQIVINIPNNDDELYSSEHYYIMKNSLYHLLHFNEDIRTGDAGLEDFYSNESSTTIGIFMEIEEKLYQGNFSDAHTLNDGLNPAELNTVELNYRNYYNLYMKCLDSEEDGLTSEDSSALRDLAYLCPGENGACIYQARALYKIMSKQPLYFLNDCEEEIGARYSNPGSSENTKWINATKLNVQLFPNPAQNSVTFLGKNESEDLFVSIRDVSGRTVLNKNLKTRNFSAKLEIDLINGIYFVAISNNQNKNITRKLVISK
ncbi:T9SS type A sorting domain-containing protein [Aurantibacillus circumpalustris]|uniref:T9SS type A sorting domain-containing protein n=1 Tax=Aurantibacillus circumpalustris TaxID=3036359 RepID=UPI00295BC606|nr:T9SS type A sorting domain-containing protein [Aurantibacillus circumpalustris]